MLYPLAQVAAGRGWVKNGRETIVRLERTSLNVASTAAIAQPIVGIIRFLHQTLLQIYTPGLYLPKHFCQFQRPTSHFEAETWTLFKL